MMKGVESIISMLHDHLMPNRKMQGTENERLRAAYLSPAWGPTNIAFDDFVKDLFERALDADTADLDAKWPRGDRFHEGFEKITKLHLPDLKSWLLQQKPDVADDAAAIEDLGTDSSSSDEGDSA